MAHQSSNSNSNTVKRLPVFCFINEEMWDIEYSANHVMKPFRLKMQYDLARATHIDSVLVFVDARSATDDELREYHSPELERFLKNEPIMVKEFDNININDDGKDDNINDDSSNNNNQNNNNNSSSSNDNSNNNNNSENKNTESEDELIFKSDNPRFLNMHTLALDAAGGSLEAVKMLKDNKCNIAINFGGGLHHCAKDLPAGFCVVNDIVLAILSLKKLSFDLQV